MATRKSPEVRDLRWGWLHFPSPTEVFYLWSRLSFISIFLFSRENESVAESNCRTTLRKIQWLDPSIFPIGMVFLSLSGKDRLTKQI